MFEFSIAHDYSKLLIILLLSLSILNQLNSTAPRVTFKTVPKRRVFAGEKPTRNPKVVIRWKED